MIWFEVLLVKLEVWTEEQGGVRTTTRPVSGPKRTYSVDRTETGNERERDDGSSQ